MHIASDSMVKFKFLADFYCFESFSLQRFLMIFHWSLSDNKSPQVSRTILSILANLNNTVVWMVSIVILFPSPLLSNCSDRTNNNFFLQQGLGNPLFPHFLSVLPSGQPERQSLLFGWFSSFFSFFFFLISLGLVVWPRLDDPFVSQNRREVFASYFLGRIMGRAYTICSYGPI